MNISKIYRFFVILLSKSVLPCQNICCYHRTDHKSRYTVSSFIDKHLKGTHQLCFRILTLRTKNKFFNESIQHVLQLIRLMRSIDNVTVILNIKLGLCSQLTTKIFGGICLGGWRGEREIVCLQLTKSTQLALCNHHSLCF